ncbi:hypothetical protein SARC_01374 [Sphaeroforma arctica JP610]|uniref:C2H2-type domain-containing protein n=1 Tax=Sphaeroforma arctica JP610 TaxID=667725 RepID=A0A0L0GC30_9EUKA|nr:hypothetical protein SARC_01374 [Sphaeroforma arctica JP610]KNC86464.1 hypothetical protein SARC_01374 [Sphaeroforma arctica JP610]|eukprot:XP_014160366.1 hypothetical protein SARC_01374 [Sphaeroforma arctica JP610]
MHKHVFAYLRFDWNEGGHRLVCTWNADRKQDEWLAKTKGVSNVSSACHSGTLQNTGLTPSGTVALGEGAANKGKGIGSRTTGVEIGASLLLSTSRSIQIDGGGTDAGCANANSTIERDAVSTRDSGNIPPSQSKEMDEHNVNTGTVITSHTVEIDEDNANTGKGIPSQTMAIGERSRETTTTTSCVIDVDSFVFEDAPLIQTDCKAELVRAHTEDPGQTLAAPVIPQSAEAHQPTCKDTVPIPKCQSESRDKVKKGRTKKSKHKVPKNDSARPSTGQPTSRPKVEMGQSTPKLEVSAGAKTLSVVYEAQAEQINDAASVANQSATKTQSQTHTYKRMSDSGQSPVTSPLGVNQCAQETLAAAVTKRRRVSAAGDNLAATIAGVPGGLLDTHTRFTPQAGIDTGPAAREHKGLYLYACKQGECRASFASIKKLLVHEEGHEDAKVYVCQWGRCAQKFDIKTGLMAHAKSHKGVQAFECSVPNCHRMFASKQALIAHTRTHPGNGAGAADGGRKTNSDYSGGQINSSYSGNQTNSTDSGSLTDSVDSGCPSTSGSDAEGHVSLATQKSVSAFVCPQTACRKKCGTRKALAEHVDAYHGSAESLHIQTTVHNHNPPTTGIPATTTPTDPVNNTPVPVEANDCVYLYPCTWEGCSLVLTTRVGLLAHCKSVHCTARPYPCKWEKCGEAFKRKEELYAHVEAHLRVPWHRCAHVGCGERFKSEGELSAHAAGHTISRKRYICTQSGCGKRFLEAELLQKHVNACGKYREYIALD